MSASQKITRSFPEFFSHLKTLDFDPTVCVDVGAAKGTPSIYSAFPNALHVAFEPLPDFQVDLRSALAPYRHSIHPCALMDAAGNRVILKHKDLYGSSLMHSRTDDTNDLININVSTLDAELENIDLSKEVLIKTDCQGADLSALKGGIKTLKSADVVIVEASFFRFWGAHHPDFYDIITFMKSQGFVVYDFLDGLCRPRDNALGQIDIVFVKENGRLRASPYW